MRETDPVLINRLLSKDARLCSFTQRDTKLVLAVALTQYRGWAFKPFVSFSLTHKPPQCYSCIHGHPQVIDLSYSFPLLLNNNPLSQFFPTLGKARSHTRKYRENMTGSDRPSIALPGAQSLSNRSRKFYDGTYKWDSDGFVDDKGGKGKWKQ